MALSSRFIYTTSCRGHFSKSSNNKNNDLIFAASQGSMDKVELLCLNGADAKFRNEDGDTALDVAAKNRWLNVVKHIVLIVQDDETCWVALQKTTDSSIRDVLLSHISPNYLKFSLTPECKVFQEISSLLLENEYDDLLEKLRKEIKENSYHLAFDVMKKVLDQSLETKLEEKISGNVSFSDVVKLCRKMIENAEEIAKNRSNVSENLQEIIANQEIKQFYEEMQALRPLFGRVYGKRAKDLKDKFSESDPQIIAKLQAEFDSLRGPKTRAEFIEFLNNDQDKNHYARIMGLVLRYAFHQGEDDEFIHLKLPKRYEDSKFDGLLTAYVFPVLKGQQKSLVYYEPEKTGMLHR